VAVAAQVLWEAAGQIGAKRLPPFVPELLARLTACGELALSPATTALVQRVSPATLERWLTAARRDRPRRGLSTTQPGAWLKQQIPIRTFAEWGRRAARVSRGRPGGALWGSRRRLFLAHPLRGRRGHDVSPENDGSSKLE
jgi:hypothetical protein